MEVCVLNSQVVPISQVVLRTGFTVCVCVTTVPIVRILFSGMTFEN